MQSVTSIEVPTNLLKMPLIKNKDIMGKKYEYDKVGQNYNVIVEPAIVKFSGFEVGKLNEIKVKVINKNKQPQRIYVFPPKSELFNVKFDKKGAIPTGMAEELYVQFKPQEYKYYYDVIKITTQDDTILIPLHAYPALNRDNLRDIFPRLIDFGTLDIGDTQTYIYPIQSKVPLNFEFEFNIVKACSDIKIDPLKGIVPGKSNVDIQIQFSPQTNITVVMEIELKIAQFDFEPLCIKIMGSGRFPANKKSMRPNSTKKLKSLTNKKEDLKLEPQIADLTLKEEILDDQQPILKESQSIKGEKIKSIKQSKALSLNRSKSQTEKRNSETLLKGRQLLEKQYLDHFNQIQSLDKEKEIRFFQCIGDPKISEDEINIILGERQQYTNNMLGNIQQKETTRYQVEINQDSAIIDYILPINEPTWDMDKNDTIKAKRYNLRRFISAVSKVMYKLRMEKRLEKLKIFLRGVTTKAEVKKLVQIDWQKAEYAGVGKKDFVQFTFDFNSDSIGFLKLPVQYEESSGFQSIKYEVSPRAGFDDLIECEQIPHNDCEEMSYKIWEYPQIVYHPPYFENIILREGAEEEKGIRGQMGPINKFITLNQKPNIIFDKPSEVENSQFLKPHKTLKLYQKLSLSTSTSTFYPLSYNKIKGIGCDLDPDIYMNHSILKQEFINRTPGYQNINLIYELPIDQFYYKDRNMQLAYDFGLDDQIEFYCPKLMENKEQDDYMTDDDSDGEQPPIINTQDSEDFLKKIEQDDKEIKQWKQNELIDIQNDLKKEVDKNLEYEKTKWISTLPSKTNDYNKFINNNINKLVIL